MRENITLIDILDIFIKWWWIIVIAAFVCGGAFYVQAEHFQDRIYESKGSFYVNSRTSGTDALTLSMQESNARLGETYIELAKSESVLTQVKDELKNNGSGDVSVSKLRSMISYSVLNETEVIEIRTLDEDPAVAQAVTNAALSVVPGEIQKIVQVGRVEVVDQGSFPISPKFPNILSQTLAGLLIGLALGCGIIFLIEFLDLRIRPENNLENMYELPVLGNIPEIKK